MITLNMLYKRIIEWQNLLRLIIILIVFQVIYILLFQLCTNASNNYDSPLNDIHIIEKNQIEQSFDDLLDNIETLGVGVEISNSTKYYLRLKDIRAKASSNVELTYQIGNYYFSKRMYDDAIKEYRRCLKLIPNHENAKYFLSLSLLHKGYLDEAFIHVRDLIDINPNSPEYYKLAGDILERMNLSEYAKDYYNKWFYLLEKQKTNNK